MSDHSENKWTRSNRETVVVYSTIKEWPAGHLSRPALDQLSDSSKDNRLRDAIENDRPIWCLRTFTRTGLDPETSSFSLFPTEDAASEATPENGTITNEQDFLLPASTDFVVGSISLEARLSAAGARGEPPYELVYEALHGAGVYHKYEIGQQVVTWVGEAGSTWLAEEFGENWMEVAVFEYCLAHFGSSALATLAARVMVATYVGQNDFDAGYASRELQMLASGSEEVALRSRDIQERRAKGGGEASRKKRANRLSMFLDEIEKLTPLVGLVSEERILSQAWDNLKEAQSDWPVTPKIRFEYEVELRSIEPFKSRYRAVFG